MYTCIFCTYTIYILYIEYICIHTHILYNQVGNPEENQLASQLLTTYIRVIFFLPVSTFMHHMKITTSSGFQAASRVKMGKSQWPASFASM